MVSSETSQRELRQSKEQQMDRASVDITNKEIVLGNNPVVLLTAFRTIRLDQDIIVPNPVDPFARRPVVKTLRSTSLHRDDQF